MTSMNGATAAGAATMITTPPRAPAEAEGEVSVAVEELEQVLQYTFRNRDLAEEALTHSSYRNISSAAQSYQRLEFVGDAALGLAFANHLFISLPGLGPGRLSSIRSANISTEKLARAAVRHGLFRFLRHKSPRLAETVDEFAVSVMKEVEEHCKDFAFGGTIKAPKVLADIVESIAAAIYVDCGFDLNILWNVFKGILEPIITSEAEQPVAMLYEFCQKHKRNVDFRNWKDGNMYVMNLFVDEQLLGIGCSEQKAFAKLNAARVALEQLWAVEAVDIDGDPCKINKNEVEEETEGSKQRVHEPCSRNYSPKPVFKIENEDVLGLEKQFTHSVQIQTPDVITVVGGCSSDEGYVPRIQQHQ